MSVPLYNYLVEQTVGSGFRDKLMPTVDFAKPSLAGYHPKEALLEAGLVFRRPHPSNYQLQFVSLPDGWTIRSVDGYQNPCFPIMRFNLHDARERVRAVIRQKFLGPPFTRGVETVPSMVVACPFMLSFHRVSKHVLQPRIRRRYGGVEWKGEKIEIGRSDNRNIIRAHLQQEMMAVLCRKFPSWEFDPRYW